MLQNHPAREPRLPDVVRQFGVTVQKRSNDIRMVAALTSPDSSREPLFLSNYALVNVVDDLARAWRVIRTFDAGHFARGRFEREANEVQRMTMKSVAAAAMMTPVSQIAASFGVAAIVTLALYQAQTGNGSVGSFAGYVAALLLLVSKLATSPTCPSPSSAR